MEKISYNNPQIAAYVGTTSIVTASETTLVTISDTKDISKSQLTVYYNVALGSATEVDFRYYVSPDTGTTWYMIPIQDPNTNILVNLPNAVIDSTTYSTGGNSLAVHDIPLSSCNKLKITGRAVTATATLNSLTVLVRDN